MFFIRAYRSEFGCKKYKSNANFTTGNSDLTVGNIDSASRHLFRQYMIFWHSFRQSVVTTHITGNKYFTHQYRKIFKKFDPENSIFVKYLLPLQTWKVITLKTGEMPEWSIGPHSKCGVRFSYRGFESLSLRKKGYKSRKCLIYTFFTPQN